MTRIATIAVLTSLLALSGVAFGQAELDRFEQEIREQDNEPGYLGVIADDRNTNGQGVKVIEVVPGGPGERAGLRKDDLIMAIEGQRVASMADMGKYLVNSLAGQRLQFDIVRDRQAQRLLVIMGRRPPPEERRFQDFGKIPEATETQPATEGAPPIAADPRRIILGVRTVSVNDEQRRRLRLPSTLGALITNVSPGSSADQGGLRVDDVIVAVDGAIVNRPTDLSGIVQQLQVGQEIQLSYYREGRFQRTRVMVAAAQAQLPAEVSPDTETQRPPLPDIPPPQPTGPRVAGPDPAGPFGPAQPGAGTEPANAFDELPAPSIPPGPGTRPAAGGGPPGLGEQDRIEQLERLVADLQSRVSDLEKQLQKERAAKKPDGPNLGTP